MVIGFHKKGFFVAPVFSLFNENVELMDFNKISPRAILLYFPNDVDLMDKLLHAIVDYQKECQNSLETGQIPDMTELSNIVFEINEALDEVDETNFVKLHKVSYDYTAVADVYGLYNYCISEDSQYKVFVPDTKKCFFSRTVLPVLIHPKCMINDLDSLDQHKQFLKHYILIREAFLSDTMYTLTYILNFANMYKSVTKEFGKITQDNLQSKIVEFLVQQNVDTDLLSAFLLVLDTIKYQGFADQLKLIDDIQNVQTLDDIKKFYETVFA